MLGINIKSCNSAAWGDSGVLPVFLGCVRLCINYFIRTINLDDHHIVKAALKEQVHLSLPWYKGICRIIEKFDNSSTSDFNRYTSPFHNALHISSTCSTTTILDSIKDLFVNSWKYSIANSSKLTFYNSIKNDYIWEPYLDEVSNFNERRSTSRLRCSAHQLKVELGRYTNTPRDERICDYCYKVNNTRTLEDETHLINDCPLGDEIRSSYNSRIQSIYTQHHEILVTGNPHSFNMAITYPHDLHDIMSSQLKLIRDSIIKASCRSLHQLYNKALQFKEDNLHAIG